MKKTFSIFCLILLAAVVCLPCVAYANSAQTLYWGQTSAGVFPLEKSPLVIQSELLTFNLVDLPDIYKGTTLPKSNVVAQYTIANPSAIDVTTKLMFPFGKLPEYISNENYDDTALYNITLNGAAVEKQMRFTYSPYLHEFDLQEDLALLSDQYLKWGDTEASTPVFKHTLSLCLQNGDTLLQRTGKFTLDASSDQYRVYVGDDFQNINGNYVLTSDKEGKGELTLYFVGADEPDLSQKISATYYDGTSNKWFSVDCGINDTTIETTFADCVLATCYDESKGISRVDWYNVLVAYANRYEESVFDAVSDCADIEYCVLRWYQYEITVPAGQTVTNTVTAPVYPTVDFGYTPYLYTYNYLLSPAITWESFSDLTVIVNTDYYIVGSKIFKRTESCYRAHFDTLPEGELSFKISTDENPEPMPMYGFGVGEFLTELLVVIFWPITLLAWLAPGALAGLAIVFGLVWVIKIVLAIVLGRRDARRKREWQNAQQNPQPPQDDKIL